MFASTFRTTVKSLLRSVTFWLVFVLFAFIVVRYGVQQVGYAKSGVGVVLVDYVAPTQLAFSSYLSVIDNLVYAGSLIYPLAILAVISTALVLNRDHGDQFFEIEKAAGIKPSVYLFGRLSALVAILMAAQELISYIVLQILVIGQGGVEEMSTIGYIASSFLRLTFANLCCALPYVLFYVGVTYFVGTLFKNGVVGSLCGFALAVAYFAAYLILRRELSLAVYFEYLAPSANKLRHFIAYFWTDDSKAMYARFGTSTGKALLCVAFLLGVFAICSAVSYVRIRRRET